MSAGRREQAQLDEGSSSAVDRAFRKDRAAVLATLIRHVGDLQVAEDAVQDAFTAAIETWPRDGVPANTAAWLTVTSRRRAIDRLRHDRSLSNRAERLAVLMRIDEEAGIVAAGDAAAADGQAQVTPIEDDRLRLIFTCCHPALGLPARVALTLRTLGGLTTSEVARAFLVPEPTMGKRIVRAKRKIADAHIPYRVPAAEELPARVRGVLRVVYLIFNEGYSATAGDQLVRRELCGEAVRLGRLLHERMPDDAEVAGLLALMHDARLASRVDQDGRYVPLAEQNRASWDAVKIKEGLQILADALNKGTPDQYQLQAAITAVHLQASATGSEDWTQIAALYDALAAISSSPVVEVNRAAAIGFADSPQAGLRLLEPLLRDPTFDQYQPLHATHAELLRRAGDAPRAAEAYVRAIALTANSVERAELERRRDGLPWEIRAASVQTSVGAPSSW